jgi:uncharacterized membrane protein
MTWSKMTLIQKLMVLGAIAFVLVLIPSLLPLTGIAPWMTNAFYYPALAVVIYAVYLIVRSGTSQPGKTG